MTGLGQFVLQVDSFAGGRLKTTATAATNEASLLAKQRIEAAYRAVGFSSLRLRNLGGAPIRIRYIIAPQPAGPAGFIFAASGAAYLADKGAPAHPIEPHVYGQRALRGLAGKQTRAGNTHGAELFRALAKRSPDGAQLSQALNTPDGPRASVQHPGFTGKRPFELAAHTLPAPVRAVYARRAAAAMVETFR